MQNEVVQAALTHFVKAAKGVKGKEGEQQQAYKHFLNGQTRFKPRWAKILKIITKTYLSLCPSLMCISDAAPPPFN